MKLEDRILKGNKNSGSMFVKLIFFLPQMMFVKRIVRKFGFVEKKILSILSYCMLIPLFIYFIHILVYLI